MSSKGVHGRNERISNSNITIEKMLYRFCTDNILLTIDRNSQTEGMYHCENY